MNGKKKDLKILMFGSSRGMGLLYYIALYSIGLKRRGHDVHLITRDGEQSKGLHDNIKKGNIQSIISSDVDNKNLISVLRTIWVIFQLDRRHRFNIVHVYGFLQLVQCFIALKIMQRSDSKIVFMVESMKHGSKYEKLFGILASIMLNKCSDIVFPISEWVRMKLICYGLKPEKAITIYNAIDIGRFQDIRGVENDKINKIVPGIEACNLIVYLAQLIPRKRIDVLLKAVPHVISQFPDTKFLICGSGPLKADLEELTKKMQISHSVFFTGNIDNKLIPSIFVLSDIGVVTSAAETFGFAIVEPMAAGKPVISTPVGIANEIIKDGQTGFLIDINDSAGLARAIIALLKDNNLRKQIGANAKKIVMDKFNLNSVLKSMEKAYYFVLQ